ncbi:MAG: hypothetical protein IJ147_01675 [Lachnospiraceae bacterium]|nr:hypothetical protein [Lachnospiraceae bacterium]
MTRKQANEYDNELKTQLQDCAREIHIDHQAGTYIVDNFIEFIPEDHVKGMVFLGKDSASYKVGNVRIDLKKAILAGIEFVASINAPESIFNYIQLLIVSALFIGKVSKQELSELEAHIVYWLHTRGTYEDGLEEERFILSFKEWYQEKAAKTLEREDIVNAINHLYQIKIADYREGNIYLKEKVWGELE